jgi:hypothetical protein
MMMQKKWMMCLWNRRRLRPENHIDFQAASILSRGRGHDTKYHEEFVLGYVDRGMLLFACVYVGAER